MSTWWLSSPAPARNMIAHICLSPTSSLLLGVSSFVKVCVCGCGVWVFYEPLRAEKNRRTLWAYRGSKRQALLACLAHGLGRWMRQDEDNPSCVLASAWTQTSYTCCVVVFLFAGGVVVTHLLVGRHVMLHAERRMRRPTKLRDTLVRTREAINHAFRTNRG